MKKLSRWGEVVNDGGYRDERCKTTLTRTQESKRVFSVFRARHETVNRQLKRFFALGHRFRYCFSCHSFWFHAGAALTQLSILDGETLFGVDVN